MTPATGATGKEANHLDMVCQKCEREWSQVFPLPMASSVFVKAIANLQCPSCGVGEKHISIRLGGAHAE